VWEDEAPVEPRPRRVQQSVTPPGRALPASPLNQLDADDDESAFAGGPRFGGQRFDRPRNPWWRPASTAGRVFILLAALSLLSGCAISAYLLKSYLDRDERFRIAGASNLQATGLTEVSREQLMPVFSQDFGRNVLFVPLSERRKQLEQIPWIERATVMRLLPDQIRISVVERQPVAFVRQGQQIGLVDANGVLLAMPPAMMAQHQYSFPVITGISDHDTPASRKTRMEVYQRLLDELDANGQKISEQISEIDLTDPQDARVLMPEQGGDILAHFGEDRFLERFERYKAHINEWRQQYPKLAAVDLRYDQQVVLEMAPGTNVAKAAADEQTAAATDAAQNNPPAVNPTARPQTIAAPKPVQTVHQTAGSSTPTKPPAKLKPAKFAGKNDSARMKAAKTKAANIKAMQKKRADAKRAALNLSKQKTAPTNRPAASAGMGQ